ncbi:hypothetical protein JTE90_008403 [Oedothorax gibbosus]|uniref:Uncharacterized protein n=1 Tax=Oedothorax gibbosus TaxID=931172 RepID=A0AAV6V473_9ARAC|nr:hypothetical protein JTE90_008403 [Oedothorax gibbosus]
MQLCPRSLTNLWLGLNPRSSMGTQFNRDDGFVRPPRPPSTLPFDDGNSPGGRNPPPPDFQPRQTRDCNE